MPLHRALRARIHLFGQTESEFVMPPAGDPDVHRTSAGLELRLCDSLKEADRQGRHGVLVVAWPGAGVEAFLDALERSRGPAVMRIAATGLGGSGSTPHVPAVPSTDGPGLLIIEGLHRLGSEQRLAVARLLRERAESDPATRLLVTTQPDAVPPDRLGPRYLEVRVAGLDDRSRRGRVHAIAVELHGPREAEARAGDLLERLRTSARHSPEAYRLTTSPLALRALSYLHAAGVELPADGATLFEVWTGLADRSAGWPELTTPLRLFAGASAPWAGSRSAPRTRAVPGGSFLMGSSQDEEGRWPDEGPVHEVTVPPFEMGLHPVTNSEYASYLEARPEAPVPAWWDDPDFTRPDQPVVGVSWSDARGYAEWANARLPSEAEWEMACRAGSDGPRPGPLDDVARYRGNSGATLGVVGGRAPNAWGLHDMVGNVWEWVEDDHHPDYEGAPADGRPWLDSPRSSHRILRGGSWADAPRVVRSATRLRDHPGPRIGNIGFRIARTAGGNGRTAS